jgi:hypothetical protein
MSEDSEAAQELLNSIKQNIYLSKNFKNTSDKQII